VLISYKIKAVVDKKIEKRVKILSIASIPGFLSSNKICSRGE
jgi:hypothetical protein